MAGVYAVCVALVVAVAGCASPKGAPDAPGSAESPSRQDEPAGAGPEAGGNMGESTRAARVLEDFVGSGAHAVAVSIGIPDWELGRITLRVAGDGAVRVEQRGSAGDNDYTARWTSERTSAFAALLRGERLLAIAPVEGDREPDDVPVDIVVMDGGDTLHTAAVWHADRERDPHLDRVLKAVDDAVREVSGGKLP